jgi:hypothetical protein
MLVITSARVHEIVALDEQPVLRNLLITHAYHGLTMSMANLLVGDLVWTGFATWASKQAGSFIRREQVPPAGRMMLDALEHDHQCVVRSLLDGISRFITNGNLSVFEELGFMFASFVEVFSQPNARTDDNLAMLVGRFSEGESMPDEVRITAAGTLERRPAGGQSLIRAAVRHYFDALRETQADARAELILLANVECGLHEQIRLQPYIAGALDTPAEQLLRLAGASTHPLADSLIELARRISTELLLTMPLPHEVLDLGSDLKAPPGADLWPPELANLRHPSLSVLGNRVGAYEARERDLDLGDRIEGWANRLLTKLELARPEAQGTGAKDWTRIDDRMRFIFELFRSRQRDAALLASPFTSAQLAEMHTGRVPNGPL